MVSYPVVDTGSLPQNPPSNASFLIFTKANFHNWRLGLFIWQRAHNMFHLAKRLQSIMLNHEMGCQRVRQLVFLHALFLPNHHQPFDRNLFACKIQWENDADAAGHYCQRAQEENHNMQRLLKMCLLIYLIDIYWAICYLANSGLTGESPNMWNTNSSYPQGFHSQLGKINTKWH